MLAEQRGSFRTSLLEQVGINWWQTPNLHQQVKLKDFFDQIDCVREAKDADQLTIVGHSWGANLALEYAAAHPGNVSRLALLSMGPLDSEMTARYRANVRLRIPNEGLEESDRINAEFKMLSHLARECLTR